MGDGAGSGLRVIRQACLALAASVALLAALALLLSWLTPWQVLPPPADGTQTGAAANAGLDGLSRLLRDWTRFEPWDGTSINVHWGSVSRTLGGSPVIACALAAGLAIALYALVCRWGRAVSRFDWRVAATVFLGCWIALDAVWQARLLQQLSRTHYTFAGKTYQEKVRASHDGLLVHFAEAVDEAVAGRQGRILVGSGSDYYGMRGAYFLYPHNVLWQRDGPEIPPREYLRSGDYIALIQPTGVLANAAEGLVAVPGEIPVAVELLLNHPAGYLFRVR